MGEVVAYRPGGAERASGADLQRHHLATVTILPVVRINRDRADPWQGLPSDSAPPPYSAPDSDPA